ncbi:hypothetical protein B0H17DRAFT_1154994 [Mycena rosella]|uniref:Uncharacterized protein n=1 Tax=Mycena rosella TaxID=1033263 RepID=A0AAD7F5G8_MYCRO|nr:hypothetical protein B0H17DRAFT_1154994 [Mycena rosella]
MSISPGPYVGPSLHTYQLRRDPHSNPHKSTAYCSGVVSAPTTIVPLPGNPHPRYHHPVVEWMDGCVCGEHRVHHVLADSVTKAWVEYTRNHNATCFTKSRGNREHYTGSRMDRSQEVACLHMPVRRTAVMDKMVLPHLEVPPLSLPVFARADPQSNGIKIEASMNNKDL